MNDNKLLNKISIMEDKVAFIQNILKVNNYDYAKIDDPITIDLIYSAFKDQQIDETNTDGLICCYYGISFKIKDNYEMAFHWYQKSAELGNSSGMNNLGRCYYYGNGTKQNYEMAFHWYQKSAELDNSFGMNNLGDCYKNGKGTTQNYEMAFRWYQKSAELGNSFGMNNLGDCYKNGKGTTQNYEMAFHWYQKSAELGHSSGMNNLGIC